MSVRLVAEFRDESAFAKHTERPDLVQIDHDSPDGLLAYEMGHHAVVARVGLAGNTGVAVDD